MNATATRRRTRGFMLTELLVVIGLFTVLISLLVPVIEKVRAAGNSAVCLSNLRQMGTAWAMYTSENRGRLLSPMASNPRMPEVPYSGYWTGVLDTYEVRGDTLFCPSANRAIPFDQNRGYGNAGYAWTGRYQSAGTTFKFNAATYRESSYGFNFYLTAGMGFGADSKATMITGVKPLSEVPVFMDAVWADFKPLNYSEASPPDAPASLYGDSVGLNSPQHWRFLIARHGRAVNSFFADGSARRVPLEETYMLTWKSGWRKYRLALPRS